MQTARFSTEWVGSGTHEDPYRPAFEDQFFDLHASGEIQTIVKVSEHDYPDSFIIEVVLTDKALAAVKADPKYKDRIVEQ